VSLILHNADWVACCAEWARQLSKTSADPLQCDDRAWPDKPTSDLPHNAHDGNGDIHELCDGERAWIVLVFRVGPHPLLSYWFQNTRDFTFTLSQINLNLIKLIAKYTKIDTIKFIHLHFFSNYKIHRRRSQRTHTHPYEYTYAKSILRSIFEDCAGKSSRLTKSPQTSRCRRERRLPLKAQTPLNPEKFAPTRVGPRTWDATEALVTTRLHALSPFAIYLENRPFGIVMSSQLWESNEHHRAREILLPIKLKIIF
jgi:hypothetical protein